MAPTMLKSSLSLLVLSLVPAFTDALVPPLVRRDVAVSNTLPTGWTSKGCYVEGANGRALNLAATAGATMTEESCIAFCSGKGFVYAGVEYSQECYCGNSITTATAPLTDCSMACAGNAAEACGGPNRLNVFLSSAAPPPAVGPVTNPGPPGWSLLGCYAEGAGGRALTTGMGTTGGGGALTVALCTTACQNAGFTLAGVEYSGECYCGNTFSNGGAPAPDGFTGCSMLCNGNSSEYCGGPNRLDAYKLGTVVATTSTSPPVTTTAAPPPPAGPITNPGPPGWSLLGCYAEGTGGRALTNGMGVPGGAAAMTVALCTTACNNAGYTLAGVEYSGECYCGNAFSNSGAPAPDGFTGCSMLCNGNSSEYCGGPNRLDAYKLGTVVATTSASSPAVTTTAAPPAGPVTNPGPLGWSLLGCYAEGTGGRALTNGMGVPGGAAAMTVALCITACNNAGYTLAGVEYSGECYCGNAFSNGGAPAPDGFTGCSMLCNGNASEYCGGPNRLDAYKLGPVAVTTSASSPVTTTTVPPATTTAAPPSGTLPAGWAYAGCYKEGTNGRAIVGSQQPDSNTMTIESCVALCVAAGYKVAGMEFASQCFCGNDIRNGGVSAPDTDCNMACSGEVTEKCGGPGRLSIYSNGSLQVFEPPAVQKTNLPGNWIYQGCLQDNVPGAGRRTFQWQLILPNTNDASTCLGACAEFGYMAGGMEYGEECYCGDVVDIATVGAVLEPEGDCNVPCTGNPSFICGAGNRISYYQWTGTPLNVWHYPQGAGAGQYQLLIGGVCIPLMTTAGVNGKYTFVEKFGTGEPNSTGAYELDLASINDFAQAWRPMHVKTDVFCSAGLTLPDKAGRQINVGGWAGESNFGVRLYWPDGQPGTWGVNDWQENVDELALQKPRWYPSAMIMSNGSILIVGGEQNSNGASQSNLEILPKVGPVLDLDFLAATDPLNLYPFLAVLPSGGIFIAYYNQARILDPATFATVKTMPQIPGNVNNPGAGRTYPLEGTAMLLPQKAPYTDPLGVIICGGSTSGAAQAIDNCVTIQPDAPNPVWTIERMPSQRVISCMTALPDGTYLILNGAHAGVAGFGLATSPNLNAVMYDPSLPVNQRFSIMANTTVARLYHSEAILMQDGRVLVSGSDPQDGQHPEEYRVEVFVPPYLLNGLQRPTYTIVNKDWAYGASIIIDVVLRAGSSGANVKVSLMGAETSTHGNTMGQRTIFPAVTCGAGTTTTCTIIAPPDAKVCPPGWYQVFVLDSGTPSVSTWVRIGGDPASLGSWPNLPDFITPGI